MYPVHYFCIKYYRGKKTNRKTKQNNSNKKKSILAPGDFLVRYFRDIFFAPLGVLFVMKTLEDERCVVIRETWVMHCGSALSLHKNLYSLPTQSVIRLVDYAELETTYTKIDRTWCFIIRDSCRSERMTVSGEVVPPGKVVSRITPGVSCNQYMCKVSYPDPFQEVETSNQY